MVLVLGHRGCAGLEPENTIRAFKRALELGVDMIEFDVRMTKDKKLVVIHDSKVDRTTNGKGFVKDYNFSDLRKLNAGLGERIPSFEEAIDFLKDKKPMIVIELKEVEIVKDVLKKIKEEKIEDKVIIVSFWHNVLKKIKENYKKINTGAIFSGRPVNPIPIAKSAKTKLLCLRYEFIDKDIVKQCHKNNIKINSWTVNEEIDIMKMIKLKIDIISSDYPNRVIEKLKQKLFNVNYKKGKL